MVRTDQKVLGIPRLGWLNVFPVPGNADVGRACMLQVEANGTRDMSFCYFLSEDTVLKFAIWQVSKQISISFNLLQV